jgi:hypothetical protein
LQCRFRLNQWLSKENLDLVDQNWSNLALKKFKENQIKSSW